MKLNDGAQDAGRSSLKPDCSTAVEMVERLSVPLWVIAGGVNTGTVATVCLVTAAALAVIILISTTVQTWKAKP